MQICHLFSTAFWNIWRITRLSTINRRWVINAQIGPVFLVYTMVDTTDAARQSNLVDRLLEPTDYWRFSFILTRIMLGLLSQIVQKQMFGKMKTKTPI